MEVLRSNPKDFGISLVWAIYGWRWLLRGICDNFRMNLKYGSEEKGSSLCKCSILLGFLMSKKQERLHSELLSEDDITNLLGFLT